MFRLFLIAVLLIPLSACSTDDPGNPSPSSSSATDSYMVLRSTTKFPFDDVAENIDIAITDLGYKIDNHAYIGRMLERTKEALGATETVYLNAQQFRFCPAQYSRNMLAADPHNIAFCPFIINVYNTPGNPKKVYVMFRKPRIVGSEESKKALRAVEVLLTKIIDEALQ
ncbi:MAG TPA: DUF302 domain-containing protein [Acidiferrobacteraceae bacterium]|nr:DUF302 domain-containing protein [Acidiferrobacteraceae bacterium]